MVEKRVVRNRRRPTSSLVDMERAGGANGSRGYDAQEAYALSRIPELLSDPDFAVLMIEGSGDVDIRWDRENATYRHFTQVKDFLVTPKHLKEVLQSFIKHAEAAPHTYQRYRIVAKAFGKQVASLIAQVNRLRGAMPLVDDDGAQIVVKDTTDHIRNNAQRIGLSPLYVDFWLDRVDIEEMSDMSDQRRVKERFVGALVMSKYDGNWERAYADMFELVKSNIGRALRAEECRNVLEKNRSAPPKNQPVPVGSVSGEICARGSLATPLQPTHLNIERVTMASPLDVQEVQKMLLETGKPIVVPATIHATFDGHVTFALAPGALIQRPVKLWVRSGSEEISYGYVNLTLRTVAGSFRGDNTQQPNAPISLWVNGEIDDDNSANIAVSFELPPSAQASARLRHKFMRFAAAVLVEQSDIGLVDLHTDAESTLVGGKPSTNIDLTGIDRELETMRELLELEQLLGVTFSLPASVTSDDVEIINKAYAILLRGTYCYAVEGFDLKMVYDPFSPQVLGPLKDSPLLVTGTLRPQDLALWGTVIRLPRRRMEIKPVTIKNKRALQRALTTKPDRFTVLMAPENSTHVIVVETVEP